MARPPESPDLSRRRGLLGAALGGLGAAPLLGCGSAPRAAGAEGLTVHREEEWTRVMASSSPTCSVVATETEGPFPLRAAIATETLVRADITEGRPGVPLALRIRVVDVNDRCKPIAGAWVYLWHCDRDGRYSGYAGQGGPGGPGGFGPNSAGQADETWLRGIQRSDAAGEVTFTTIFPGWYEGRITHVHCMVFLAGTHLSSNSPSMATTQFAFPPDVTAAVCASPGYRGQNTSVRSIEDDGVFADGTATEMLSLAGSVRAGFVAGIVVGVDQTVSNRVGGGGPPGGPGGPSEGWPPGGMPPGDPQRPPPGWGPPSRGGPPRGRGGPG